MESHYKIIWDKEQVETFAKFALEQMKEDGSCIEVILFSRRKYEQNLPRGEYILKRLFFDRTKTGEEFYRELLKLHVPYGSYSPSEISQNSLCIYCLLRPKDQLTPLGKVLNECLESLRNKEALPTNILGKYQIEIGKTSCKGGEDKIVQIDVDNKDPQFLEKFKNILQECNILSNIKVAIETKNGFHLAFLKDKNCDMGKLYNFKMGTAFKKETRDGKIMTDYAFNTTNEPSVIIPGTYQGGYKAHFTDVFNMP